MKAFNIDINSTKNCNLRCKYCLESKSNYISNKNFKDPDGFIRFLDKFMDTDYYRANFSHTTIGFWGGEPTLNKELFKKVTGRYKNNDKVMFLVYTNGYQIPNDMMDMFISMNGMKVNNNPKLVIQISYDGDPVHDMSRVNVKGEGTSDKVRESIQKVKSSGLYLVLKSTISPDNFKYMYESYLDVLNQLTENGYFPSIDLHGEYKSDEYKMFGEDLYNSLTKIAAHEITNRISKFKWFRDDKSGKALCSAGADMISVDTDGNIVPCHGALYMGDINDHIISNVSDDDAIEKVINSMEWFKTFVFTQPDKCRDCKNIFCLRCNSSKFSLSDKSSYQEKWTDHPSQDYLCYFFDIVDLVYRAKKSI